MNPDKKLFQEKCLEIVQKYIEIDFDNNENSINEFLEDCQYLTKSYYEDLTEERATIDLCGFTFCDKHLSKTVKKQFKSKQNYHIHNNKVYDIRRRKNFCSDQCFRQSEFIKDQLSDEPIYLRKTSTSSRIKLYDGHNGQPGDEFKLNDELIKSLKNDSNKTKTNELRKNLLKNEKSIESKLSAPYLKIEEFSELKQKFTNFNIQEKLIDETEKLIENTNNDDDELLDEIDRMSISTASSISNLSTVSSNTKRKKLKKQKFFENIVKRISSWITDDTRKFLGINSVMKDENPKENFPEIEYEDNEKRMERYRWQYIRLCSRLNEEEIEDEKYDRMVLQSNNNDNKKQRSKTNEKSVIKKEDTNDLPSEDKLWNFFTCPTISTENDDVDKKMKKVRFTDDTKDDDSEQKNNDDNEEIFFLPLNDNQHANIKRKQLFLQEIHTFLQEILENHEIENNDEIFEQIHSLIRTFDFQSETIALGRKENFLVSIFLFRILLRYRMFDKSENWETVYRTNIFISKIFDQFNLTFESIDKNIDKIFS